MTNKFSITPPPPPPFDLRKPLFILTLALIFSLLACKEATTDPTLIGTWKAADNSAYKFFKDGIYEYQLSYGSNHIRGTCTAAGSSVTITPTEFYEGSGWYNLNAAGHNEEPKTGTYSISGKTLTLTWNGDSPKTYTKQ